MAASTYFDQIQQLYIAYFGRPADSVGLTFWANQVDAANGRVGARYRWFFFFVGVQCLVLRRANSAEDQFDLSQPVQPPA
jgi:hypothetical protein